YKKSNRELLLKTSGGRFIITDNTKEKDNKTLNNKIYRGSIDKQNLKTDEIDYQQISVKNNKVVTKNYKLKKNNFILKSFSKKKVVLQFKGEPTFYTLTTKGSSKVSNYSALDWIKQIINNVISSISKGALGLLGGIGNLIKNSIPVF
ncbi:MAG: hypothetical protein LBC17_01675, partial [Lactobacillaceae bacterium]|nr:hypothetical protein [Lactobacillaceae bacterium]